jgi:magnesium transporter
MAAAALAMMRAKSSMRVRVIVEGLAEAVALAKRRASGDTAAMLRLFGPNCSPAPVDVAKVKAIPKGTFWIDLLNPTRAEEKLAEKALGQNVPTREEMAEIEPSSRLYERQGATFMTASVLHGISADQPDTDPVSFVLTEKLLVTVRYVDPAPFIQFNKHLCAEPELATDSVSLLVRLMDTIIDRLADELEASAAQMEKVSGQVFSRRNNTGRQSKSTERRLEAILHRIGEVQRLLAEIRESAVSTSRMLNYLATIDLVAVSQHSAHVESLMQDVRALLDHSSFLAENLTFLLDASLGLITLEQNFVMKVFSVFAVIFMPPTLIAGIYGMNFEHMPELKWLHGYPFALVLILASAIIPFWVAKRSRWL